MENFLFAAVLEGLHSDGMPIELARSIANEEHGKVFVGKCPICKCVKRGLDAYHRGGVLGWGKGLDQSVVEELKSQVSETRHAAFQSIIARYVKAKISKSRMTGRERKLLLEGLVEGQKEGMNLKGDGFGDFCPSCDGSCAICDLDDSSH